MSYECQTAHIWLRLFTDQNKNKFKIAQLQIVRNHVILIHKLLHSIFYKWKCIVTHKSCVHQAIDFKQMLNIYSFLFLSFCFICFAATTTSKTTDLKTAVDVESRRTTIYNFDTKNALLISNEQIENCSLLIKNTSFVKIVNGSPFTSLTKDIFLMSNEQFSTVQGSVFIR